MLGAISVLFGVGVVCASGIAISSGMKFFLSYDYDLNKKINESKASKNKREREIGGENHELRMEKLQSRVSNRQ